MNPYVFEDVAEEQTKEAVGSLAHGLRRAGVQLKRVAPQLERGLTRGAAGVAGGLHRGSQWAARHGYGGVARGLAQGSARVRQATPRLAQGLRRGLGTLSRGLRRSGAQVRRGTARLERGLGDSS